MLPYRTPTYSGRQPTPATVPARTSRKASVAYRILSDKILEMKTLGSAAKLVLMALQKFGRDGRPCFPSNPRIAETCGLSTSTVKRALVELVEHGLIEIESDAPGTPKGRRIHKRWMDDPALHPHLQAQIEPPPTGSDRSDRVVDQDGPRENKPSEPPGTTRNDSSSSMASVMKEEGPVPGDNGKAVELAVMLWPTEPPGTVTAKVVSLCRDHGPDAALAALRVAEMSGKARPWGYIVGTARNLAREKGAVASKSTPAPRPTTKPTPIADVRPTKATSPCDRWEEWLNGTSADIRHAIETATTDVIGDVKTWIDRARSPAIVEPKIRTRLGLPDGPDR